MSVHAFPQPETLAEICRERDAALEAVAKAAPILRLVAEYQAAIAAWGDARRACEVWERVTNQVVHGHPGEDYRTCGKRYHGPCDEVDDWHECPHEEDTDQIARVMLEAGRWAIAGAAAEARGQERKLLAQIANYGRAA